MYGDEGLEKLVGQKVAAVYRNDAKDHLRIVMDGCAEIHLDANGDCCSSSWFEHISGVCFLLCATVAAVEPGAEVDDVSNDEHECLRFYNYNLRTDKGTCAVEMRNSSNGYYGGSIEHSDGCECKVSIPVADDF